MKQYLKTQLKNIRLSADIFTVDNLRSNLSDVKYLNSDEVGQDEIVNTLNTILSALKCEGENI